MDAVLTPLFLSGGLSPSMYTGTRTVSTHYLSPSAVRSTALHRRLCRFPLLVAAAEPPSAPLPAASAASRSRCSRGVVVMYRPPGAAGCSGVSRAEAVDYYAATLARVLGSEEEAQMRMYDASWDGSYAFCCEINEEASRELAKMPGVLSVMPDMDDETEKDNHSSSLKTSNLVSISDGPPFHLQVGKMSFGLSEWRSPELKS